jgi:hypothetical protein
VSKAKVVQPGFFLNQVHPTSTVTASRAVWIITPQEVTVLLVEDGDVVEQLQPGRAGRLPKCPVVSIHQRDAPSFEYPGVHGTAVCTVEISPPSALTAHLHSLFVVCKTQLVGKPGNARLLETLADARVGKSTQLFTAFHMLARLIDVESVSNGGSKSFSNGVRTWRTPEVQT